MWPLVLVRHSHRANTILKPRQKTGHSLPGETLITTVARLISCQRVKKSHSETTVSEENKSLQEENKKQKRKNKTKQTPTNIGSTWMEWSSYIILLYRGYSKVLLTLKELLLHCTVQTLICLVFFFEVICVIVFKKSNSLHGCFKKRVIF